MPGVPRGIASRNVPNRDAVDFFEANAAYYARSQYRAGRRTFINGRHDTISSLLDRLALPARARVLDAGCGPGKLTRTFVEKGCSVCAVDLSPRMLEIARSGLPDALSAGASFQVASIEALPFAAETFDVVCSAGVIEYLQSYELAISEFGRVLKPGGLLILPTTNLLAVAHWLRPVMDPIARIPAVARLFGLKLGTYRVWFHYLPRFKRRLRSQGFDIEAERYFYLALPRPLDRMFPSASRRVEAFFDHRMHTWAGRLAEGYLAIARKSVPPTPGIGSPPR